MKGIILSGGSGTRLYPLTISISKQLLPIYDKPMIYYSLVTLMNLNIREILIITTVNDLFLYKRLFGNGKKWGLKINYETQKKPKGIAESIVIGKKFIKDSNIALILGDNFFYGINFNSLNLSKLNKNFGAKIFAYYVDTPERYGVVNFIKNKVISIEEKPKKPKSNYAATGLYLYDNNVVKYVKQIKPSQRNELEITDLNNIYLQKKNLEVHKLSQGTVWLDAGTTSDLLKASQYVQTIQDRQRILIGSPEETALIKGWINKENFKILLKDLPNNDYKNKLKTFLLNY